MANPFNAPLPSVGQKPWTLNPAIIELRGRQGTVEDVINTGRLSASGLADELAAAAATVEVNDATVADLISESTSDTNTALVDQIADAETPVGAELRTTIVDVVNSRAGGSRGVAFCGDSNTAAGVTGAGGAGVYNLLHAPLVNTENNSWVGWAILSAQGRFHAAAHAATPGITPATWNTQFLAGVVAAAPYAAVDALGTNNVENLSQQVAALTAMYDAFDAAGIKVIVCAIPPKTGNVADVLRLNLWKQTTARERGYLFIDNYAAVVDPATGLIATAYDSDGTHWNAVGARAVGLAFGAAITAAWPDVSNLAKAQPAPGTLVNKPLLLVKSGFVPEDWTALGYGSASTAVETVAGVAGKMFSVTQTATGNNTSGAVALNADLIPGRRYRLSYKYDLTIVGAAPTAASVRLVITTGGGTTLCYLNTLQDVPLGTIVHEFVCPTLPSYNYRLNMSLNGGGIGTKQRIGQVTVVDLTAAGL